MVTETHAAEGEPTDWSDWQLYREGVVHPCTLIKPDDLIRARANIARYDWAQRNVDSLRTRADAIVKAVTPTYLESMLEITTPGCTGPCPACRAKGLPWHPNGQWQWSSRRPEKLSCRVCKTVFPHPDFPESIVIRSKWDPRQEFGFIGGDTFRCFGYTYARPSLSGIIRARKVGYVSSQLATAAEAYALTGEIGYARVAKSILLRLAEVFPKYLVRAGYGYGEYADCDPHAAAENISKLPTDEIVYPPNEPNRQLYAGYWAASRIGSSGMDGGWVTRVTVAYDLTCTATGPDGPVYSADERLRIEQDVLLEGSYLAACDSRINNKSVGNRAGAAMVGLCVGHPGLVRFGLDGFRRTVEDWFLPDGGSSESPAYAMMTMGGVYSFGLAFRDYSEPEGYTGTDGLRLEHFNACRDTRYGDCWQGMFWTLQGDLRHPPSADSYRTTSISPRFAELVALSYPTEEHLSFLKETAGETPSRRAARDALLYREPGLEEQDFPTFSLPDVVFPFLAQGHLRRGLDGRKGLALLNAADWGGHHHYDSLDLYYWQDGRELLSDLGYLWDHQDSDQTKRTRAHNLVLIDGQRQRRERGGSFHLFSVTPQLRIMEASSHAYEKASVYRRTCAQIDHGDAGSYLVDIFRAAGGSTRDYVFHGPGSDYTVDGLALSEAAPAGHPVRFAVRFKLPTVGDITIDQAELREIGEDGQPGPNLIAPLQHGPDNADPKGWGMYVGNGRAEWGWADGGGVRFAALSPDEKGTMNAALILGQSDGYTGASALAGAVGKTYRLRYTVRGNADLIDVGFVMWPNNPGSTSDRVHGPVSLGDSGRGAAGAEAATYEVTFALPGSGPTDQRRGPGDSPWRLQWQVDENYRFNVFAPGAEGEEVRIHSGWGQRDHRNTDRGATLPYVTRRREKPGGSDTFISVFEGTSRDGVVRRVSRLSPDVPGVAAVAVTTEGGVDVLVSHPEGGELRVATPAGDLTTDALAACLIMEGGNLVSVCMVGGSRLTVGDVALSTKTGVFRGNVLAVASEAGQSWFTVVGDIPDPAQLAGTTLFVTGEDGIERAYPVRKAQPDGGNRESGIMLPWTRLYTKFGHVGFEARAAKTYRLPITLSWRKP